MHDDMLRDRLAGARGFVFDLDGTLVLGDRRNHGLRPLPGAVEITGWAAARGRPFVVFTNGTTRTPAQLASVMREIGFVLPDEAMMTPASSAVRVLADQGHRRVMVLGGPGLAEPLRKAGFEVVPPAAGGGGRGAGRLVPRVHHARAGGGLPRGVGRGRTVQLLADPLLRGGRRPGAGHLAGHLGHDQVADRMRADGSGQAVA